MRPRRDPLTLDKIVERLRTDRSFLHTSVWAAIAVSLLLVIVVIPPLVFSKPEINVDQGTTEKGTVRRILEEGIDQGPNGNQFHQRLEVDLKGGVVTIDRTEEEHDPHHLELNAGDKVLVTSSPSGANGERLYFV